MKDFIADNVTRCNNNKCPKRLNCKRFGQLQLDIAQNVQSKSIVTYNFVQCEKLIKF